jgi:hypothetical protein
MRFPTITFENVDQATFDALKAAFDPEAADPRVVEMFGAKWIATGCGFENTSRSGWCGWFELKGIKEINRG